MSAEENLTVFFSWQSDVAPDLTTRAIRSATRAVFSDIEEKHGCRCELDEATRKLPGSPNIPIAIINKIKKADIFIADITAVTQDGTTNKRFPNPNVTFELGFAVAHLGWDRIIMLYNTHVAELKDLPFDFEQQRISPYKLSSNSKKSSERKSLEALLKEAIDIIAIEKPRRPRELEGKTDREIKRERDVRTIRRALSLVSTSLIEQHIQNMPEHIFYSAPCMSDFIREMTGSNQFKLYDQELYTYFKDMGTHLHGSFAAESFYTSIDENGIQHLTHSHNPIHAAERSKKTKAAQKSVLKLTESLAKFTDHIRRNYLDIDLEEEDSLARKEFRRATEFTR